MSDDHDSEASRFLALQLSHMRLLYLKQSEACCESAPSIFNSQMHAARGGGGGAARLKGATRGAEKSHLSIIIR